MYISLPVYHDSDTHVYVEQETLQEEGRGISTESCFKMKIYNRPLWEMKVHVGVCFMVFYAN